MGAIDTYIADLENAKDLYQKNWVLPYGSAYTRAHSRFKETLDSQAKYDAMKLELFLTFATIGMGAGMGAMFGKAAFRAVVTDQALNLVCNRNMNRMFNVMAGVSASVPGTFIVEQTWDAVAGIVSTQAKAQVALIFTESGARAGITEPQEMQNDLQGYVLRVKTAAHRVAAEVRDSSLSTQRKDAIAASMRRGRFFAGAPTRSLIPDIQRAADAIELSWYMIMVMKSDYTEERTIGQQGARDIDRTRRLGPITVPTTDPSYGAAPSTTRSGYGLGYSTSVSTRVAYDNLGNQVLNRVNTLWQARTREDFIPNAFYQSGNTTSASVPKAERMLDTINRELVTTAPG